MLTKGDFVYQLRQRSYELEKQIEERTKNIINSPEGMLRIVNRGTYNQYYVRQKCEKAGVYLKKSDIKRIMLLAQKKYDALFIEEAKKEQELIESFLENYSGTIPEIYNKFPDEIRDKLRPADLTDDEYAKMWKSIPYTPKEFGKGDAVHLTNLGLRVRSKSEVIIAGVLDKFDIPYKFECPLKLANGKIIHPDFTILNKKTREIVYYEHLGKMEEIGYVKYNLGRLKEMEESGIYIGKNLIFTYETYAKPLNTKTVEKMLMSFFG